LFKLKKVDGANLSRGLYQSWVLYFEIFARNLALGKSNSVLQKPIFCTLVFIESLFTFYIYVATDPDNSLGDAFVSVGGERVEYLRKIELSKNQTPVL
jgi:hypothetical protein